jgi:prepilin-type processing-associated H-X9-DG protein
LTVSGYADNDQIFACPAWEPVEYGVMFQSYGINFYPPNGTVLNTAPHTNCRFLKLSKSKAPSSLFVIGDTISLKSSQYLKQSHAIILAGSSTGEGHIHMRHADGSNMAFADGHVERCGQEQLIEVVSAHYSSGQTLKVVYDESTVVQLNP